MRFSFFINRNLRLLWFGQVISQAGDSLYQIALIWLLLEMTGSATVTGLVTMSSFLPTLLFGLWAGVLADHVDRRNLMMGTDIARALLVLILPVLFYMGKLNSLILGIITFSIASCSAFFNPARDAIIPQIVPKDALTKANALIQTSWQLAVLLGPLLASFLLKTLGVVNLFFGDSFSFVVSLTLIYLLRIDPQNPPPITEKQENNKTGFSKVWSLIGEGVQHAINNKVILILLIITALDNLILMGAAMIGTPIFVKTILGKNASVYALIEACYASGMVIGIPLVHFLENRMTNGKMIAWGMILDGLTFIPLLWISTTAGAIITILIHAIFIPMITAGRATLIQHYVPANLQGRIFSLNSMAVVGCTALSVSITGVLADYIAINYIFAGIGTGAALCGMVALFFRSFREAD
ncbi:MAG TPA: MFS transporter [Deltaproteobacteria bacterium]|nr:MFS transporter [Deltaproteobacteria bacterium]